MIIFLNLYGIINIKRFTFYTYLLNDNSSKYYNNIFIC